MAQAVNQTEKDIVIWVDSDPNAQKEQIIKNAGYEFIYFGDTQKCIDYFFKYMTTKRIVGLITSKLGNSTKGGLAMIDEIMGYQSSMKCVPVCAICSTSIKTHAWIKIITESREEVQIQIVNAIKQNKPNNDKHISKLCGAKGCKENHVSHYCRLCDKWGVNHRAMECPTGKILYHGAKGDLFVPIISKSVGQLKASRDGRLGNGLYFTDKYSFAEVVAMNHPSRNVSGCVFEVKVNLAKMKNIGKQADKDWHNEYDSCMGFHPPWLSFKDGELTEYCVKDENKTRIRSVTLIDTHINADIFAPRLKIILKGNSTINKDRISGDGWTVVEEKVNASVVNFESCNNPNFYIRHSNFELWLRQNENNALYQQDRKWRIVDGLYGNNTISIKSSGAFLSYYARHCDFTLQICLNDNTELFKKDASFHERLSLIGDPAYVSYESVNCPGYYIRHCNYRIRIDQSDNTEMFKKDASWKKHNV